RHAGVVVEDDQHVGRTLRCTLQGVRRPVGFRIAHIEFDFAVKVFVHQLLPCGGRYSRCFHECHAIDTGLSEFRVIASGGSRRSASIVPWPLPLIPNSRYISTGTTCRNRNGRSRTPKSICTRKIRRRTSLLSAEHRRARRISCSFCSMMWG